MMGMRESERNTTQKAQEAQTTHETREAHEAQETQEAQEAQEAQDAQEEQEPDGHAHVGIEHNTGGAGGTCHIGATGGA